MKHGGESIVSRDYISSNTHFFVKVYKIVRRYKRQQSFDSNC